MIELKNNPGRYKPFVGRCEFILYYNPRKSLLGRWLQRLSEQIVESIMPAANYDYDIDDIIIIGGNVNRIRL